MKRISFILMFAVLSVASIVAQEYAEVYVICENHLKAKYTDCLEYDIIVNNASIPTIKPNTGICVRVPKGLVEVQTILKTTQDLPPMKIFLMRGLTSFVNRTIITNHPARRKYQYNLTVQDGETYYLILQTIKNKNILLEDVLAHKFRLKSSKTQQKQVEKKIAKGKYEIVGTYEVQE